ncbi:MAG TPA: hypothetical protein PKZ66_02575 [Chitinophagaceae bacterium]|nr:hypothetical protein [Chitinophagaceae bacterium]
MILKIKTLLFCLAFTIFCVHAQKKDSTKVSFIDSVKAIKEKTKVTDTSKTSETDSTNNKVDSFYSTTGSAKVVKKLEDPRLGLTYEFITKIKRMKPNQILIIDEKFVRNEKRVDEYGLEYEATVTIRFSFSQDMITGIVKEVPLYATNGRETNLIDIKIPIKFCCTTPMDSVHKKKHCGKMSELNDFEDNDGCKDWVQVEAGSGSKKSSGKPTIKGKGITGQTSVTGDSNDDDDEEVDKFGKPISKKKKKGKKNKKNKGKIEDEDIEQADSTQSISKDSLQVSKPSGKKIKGKNKEEEKEGFGKPKQNKKKKGKGRKEEEEDTITENGTTDSTENKPTNTENKETPSVKKDSTTNEKIETEKKVEEKTESKKDKKKKKKKDNHVEKEEPKIDSSNNKTTEPAKEQKTETTKDVKVDTEKKEDKTEEKKEEEKTETKKDKKKKKKKDSKKNNEEEENKNGD